MNIQKFKETVSGWNQFEEKFNQFRIWVTNFFEQWLKEREIAWNEEEQNCVDPENFIGTEQYENFMYEWNYTSSYDACNLYSKLGIKVEKGYKDDKIQYDSEGYFYYSADFIDLYKIIQKQEDDVKFCYGLLILLSAASGKQLIFQKYVMKGLKEYGLDECMELIDEEIENVFVAMWFDKKMKMARNKIERAVKECGYRPILVDVKEHNGQIVPEILKEISDSKYVIADLTGQRGGVYYEAGYAMAKDKQVILCCRKGRKSTHFDVAQINTIYWEDEEDLYERLINRIKSTIGEKL